MLSCTVAEAQEFMQSRGLAGWLLHDYRRSNPIFWQVVGGAPGMVTRPSFLMVPREGAPRLLAHHVDTGRFAASGFQADTFRNRNEMVDGLRRLLAVKGPVAMEYSPLGALPRASRVDAGTIELVRSLGAEVVSSADLFQYATQRWSGAQLQSHMRAAEKLGRIVLDAFAHIGEQGTRNKEHDTALFIRRRFDEEGLELPDGPVVAVNAHSSDPHYEPSAERDTPIRPGDWVLIDLWAKEKAEGSVYADITWVGYVGSAVPEKYKKVWDVVSSARDRAVEFLQRAHREGRPLQGWEVDKVARDFIAAQGYGDYFTHRLGHSIGEEVHGDGVNLDSWETRDTRTVMQGVGFSVEPGVYLPEFGVRSEIDVFVFPDGPRPTTPVQREVVLIGR